MLLLTLTGFATAHAQGAEDVACTLDGAAVVFEDANPPGRPHLGIDRRRATLSTDAFLHYETNAFYNIGGSVTLHADGELGRRLLRWDSPHEADVLAASVDVDGQLLECRVVR